MKKGEIKSWARHYEDLPKIPRIITRNYNRSPHYIKFKQYMEWGMYKRNRFIINPEFAYLFENNEAPTHIKDEKGRYKRNS